MNMMHPIPILISRTRGSYFYKCVDVVCNTQGIVYVTTSALELKEVSEKPVLKTGTPE